jgi:uncharacterized protein YjeT (DUF2065 family)
MQWLPKIIAVLIIIDGIVVLFRPDLLKKYCQLFSQGATIYMVAILYALIGAGFLFGASKECRYELVIIAFGILAVAGAISIIALPQKARALAGWFGNKSTATLRFLSIIYLLIGAFLVYSA